MPDLKPIAPNPVSERSTKDGLDLLREDIQIGMELSNSPAVLAFIKSEYDHLVYQITHMQPSTESDRDVVLALNTANAKMNVLEKLYNLAYKLPEAMEMHKAITQNTQSE